jgi:hypothetical protein
MDIYSLSRLYCWHGTLSSCNKETTPNHQRKGDDGRRPR